MSYTINYSNDTKTSLTILPNSVDDSLPLTFYGYNHSDYGTGLWTNLLHLLENFASDGSTLLNPIEGMLWYNNHEKVLNIYKNTGWSEIFDLEKYEAIYGTDIYGIISKITAALKSSPQSANVGALLEELSKLFVPLTGGTLTGNLYLPDETYSNYKTLSNSTQKVVSTGFLEWFITDYIVNYKKPLSAGFDDGGFGAGFDDGSLNASNIGDFLPLNVEESLIISGETLNISSDIAFTKLTIPTTVTSNCAINKEYADGLLTENSLFSKINNTNQFKTAIDNAAVYTADNSDSTVNVSEVLSYMSIYDKAEVSGTTSTDVYTTPLSINITPASKNSKFYINVSLLLSNGTTPGSSICGLYRNGNALIEKFSIIDRGTDADLIASCTTFIDAPNDINPVTYDIRIYNELAAGKWYTNKSADGTKSGTSYMTILEYQDTNFVTNVTEFVAPATTVPVASSTMEYKIPNPAAEYYEYTVPDGVTKLSVDIIGAGGGAGGQSGDGKIGGQGGQGIKMSADITVTPKEVLRIYVGCGGAGGGTSNSTYKTTQKSIFRNPDDSALPAIVNKKTLLATNLFSGASDTFNPTKYPAQIFLKNNDVWGQGMPGTLNNVVFEASFPRTAPYIVSSMIDNYGNVKIDDVLIVDVPTHTLVFSKGTKLNKGTHYIKLYAYNVDGPKGLALDIRESSSGFNNGGIGGTSGPDGYSGEGGYGGGSSAIVKADGTVLLVAAGGGGGGGADTKGIPTGLVINGIPKPTTGTVTYTDNGDGKTPGAGIDGGGGGGGGGGYSADGKGIGIGGIFTSVNADSNTYGGGGTEGKSYINTDYVTVTQTIYPSTKGTPGYGGIAKTSTAYVASTVGINEDGQCGLVKITTVNS
jgi:hypothetical protein